MSPGYRFSVLVLYIMGILISNITSLYRVEGWYLYTLELPLYAVDYGDCRVIVKGLFESPVLDLL